MKIIISIILCVFLMTACSSESRNKQQLVTVEQKAFSNKLFYTGVIKPLKTIVIPSPAEGVIIDMPFQYGTEIKQGQLLVTISSLKFMTDYKAALMQYIKAKSEFNNSETQLTEAKFLYKNELISKDEFKTKEATFYGNQLALLQAKDALEILLQQLDIKNINLYKLTIADIDKITQALHSKTNNENLRILAPANGVVLSSNKGEDDNKKLTKGDAIKQGDVLATIGDMSGISVQIKVNELAVNEIKLGQSVQVTGIAFQDYTLAGKITRIDKQGETSSGGMPTFTAEVIVPKLTEQQRKEIHVGMSAKVEINISEEKQMMVPIKAIKEKQGQSYLQVYDEKTKHNKEVQVQTGKTTAEMIAILSGIKQGDKVVISG